MTKKAAGGAIGFRLGIGLSALLVATVMVLAPFFTLPMARAEMSLITLPLALSFIVFVATAGSMFTRPNLGAAVAQPALAGLIIALTWSGIVAFTYDVPRAWDKQAIVVENMTYFTSLYTRGDVTIAKPKRDDFASFGALLAAHFRARLAVYAWFSDINGTN